MQSGYSNVACALLSPATCGFSRYICAYTRFGSPTAARIMSTRRVHIVSVALFAHHIINALTDGLKSKIQSLKSAATRFRSFDNYRNRILFFCGNPIFS